MKILPQIALLFLPLSGFAQTTMDLEAAILYAMENNIDVERQRVIRENTKEDHTLALASLFPTLDASTSINNSYGRSIDPETNSYSTVGNINNTYGVSSRVTIFSGLAKINSIKAARLRVEMGGFELQQAKDEMALQVMRLYYDAIYYLNSVDLMSEQLEAAEQVLHYTEKLFDLGLKSEVDVALAVAEVANYELRHTQQSGQYKETLLELKEVMNYPSNSELTLLDSSTKGVIRLSGDYDIEINPEVKSAQIQIFECETNLKVLRGGYLPTITLNGGFNTNYFRQLDAESAQRLFSQQLRDNHGYYVGATLTVPIFNNLNRRGAVSKSCNNLRIAQLQFEQTKLRLTRYIKQTEIQSATSYEEYLSAERKIDAYDLASQAMMQRYKEGLVDIIDLQKSSNDLLLAKVEKLRAWLNYQIYNRMTNYYSGGTLYGY